MAAKRGGRTGPWEDILGDSRDAATCNEVHASSPAKQSTDYD